MGPKRRGMNPAPSLEEDEDELVGCAEEVLKP
jgi:hypothetical protein